ncbi:NUDIX hydrolase [Agarivorans sp. MS3-6]|uniref:NUDIX hydrolase n=1 Tax=Agarivorans sp. TSD2052 TaxID=2937286 RepID=UPI00200F39A5|nr:NUDIX domain-containing protein [Agarivorans sp. TSD2052]UPW20644.1 NUDIX domain-containing protein [Agarivorans sp. TSD2052]
MRQPFSVNVFLYRFRSGAIEYLMLKRVPRPDMQLGAFWQAVTGGMEEGENIQQTAVREVYEETNLRIARLQSTNFSYRFLIKDQWRDTYGYAADDILETVFCAEVCDEPILSNEHSDYQWLPYNEAIDLLEFTYNQQAISIVDNMLRSNS